MVLGETRSMRATGSGTRIHAFVSDTGQMTGTLLVDGTLRFAFSIWITLKSRNTGAGCSPVSLFADCIDTTGTWSAWVYDLRFDRCC